MNYSIFRSRTFYTLVFQFVYNGFLAISGNLNPTALLIGNAILSTLASYFHLETGKSTSGKN